MPLSCDPLGTEPCRTNYTFLPEWTQLVLWTLAAITAAAMVYGFWRRWSLWKKGDGKRAGDTLFARLKTLIIVALLQKKVLRRRFAGLMHIAMYAGFIALAIGTTLVFINADFLVNVNIDVLRQNNYLIFKLALDFMGLCFLVGLGMAFYRRFVEKPKYLRRGTSDLYLPAILFILVFQGFLIEAVRLAVVQPQWKEWSIVGYPLSMVLRAGGVNESMATATFSNGVWTLVPTEMFGRAYLVFWWFHVFTAGFFLVTIPWTKASHFVFSPANTFYERVGPYGRLSKPFDVDDLMKEGAPEIRFGAASTKGFPWFDRLQFDACTICGRCTSVCPAWLTGKPLNPMNVILDLRQAMTDEAAGPMSEPLPDFVGYEELWDCTTCMACMRECPVNIRHVPFIVDLRRNFVMELTKMPETAAAALKNVEQNFNPMGIAWDRRAAWAEGLGVKTLADDPKAEYLFWVGCMGSYDDHGKKVAASIARLLQRAGVSFGILGVEEKCTGDPARRMGNEYLAQMMIKQNIETLNKYGVRKIITMCPHCTNSLTREYPDFGGKYEVIHHSQFLMRLLKEGKLKPSKGFSETIAYHDACYLGRYNGIFEEPRDVVRAIPGTHIVELMKNKEIALCCGGGGGRLWMEETLGKKVSVERTEQVLASGAKTLATACPYCLIMFDDAAKTMDIEKDFKRKDIAELLEQSVGN